MIDLLILMVIVVGLSLAVYHIAQYCTKETPFEQAVAEQRQKRELETGPISTKNDKLHKKAKQLKKVKPKKEENESSSKETSPLAVSQSQTNQGYKKIHHQELSKITENKKEESTNENISQTSATQDLKKDIKKKKDLPKIEKEKNSTKKQDDGIENKVKQNQQQLAKGTNAISLTVEPALVGQPAASKAAFQNLTNNHEVSSQQLGGKGTSKDMTSSKLQNKETVNVQSSETSGKNSTKETGLLKSQVKVSASARTQSNESLSKKLVQSQESAGEKIPVQEPITVKAKESKTKISKESELVKEQFEVIGSQIQNAEKKKKKEKPIDEKKVKLNVAPDDALTRLLPIINKSHLSGGEIQMLIESLLNKQQLSGNPGGEWVEKGRVDPVKEFKRQLEEMESQLQERIETNKALSAKIVDMRGDLNSERTRSSNLKKQLEASESRLVQKLEASANSFKENLTTKISEVKASMEKEFQAKLIQQKQASTSELELANQQIHSKLTDVEEEARNAKLNCLELEKLQQQTQSALDDTQKQLQQIVQSKDELLENCQQYQHHMDILKDQLTQQETAYNARLAELQQNSSASKESFSQTTLLLNHAISERDQLQQQVKNLENVRELQSQNLVKLKETQSEKIDLENRLLNSEKELSKIRELVSNQKAQIECLIEEKESLASQSVRPAAEGQENGDIHSEQNEQITSNISAIYEDQISSLTKEVSKLKDDLTYQRRKNDEASNKWERESKLTRQVLSRLFPSVNVSENLDHSTFLKHVETAAVESQTAAAEVKPQIIEKIVEKVVQDPSLVKQLEEMKHQNEELQKKIELQNEEKLALESKKSSGEEQSRRITSLEIENKSLEERVAHYQSVLLSTETLLKTLESSVENEEASWREKLEMKEEAVRQLNADKINLTLRVTELQSTLDKVQQAEEMESQLNILQEKLNKEEVEKTNLKEQLTVVQEQLKISSMSQAINSNGPSNGVECPEIEGSSTK